MVHLAIFDYGVGNIFSLKNSFEKAGAIVDVITTFDEPNTYDGLLLPGVGNFDPAIKSITGMSGAGLREYAGDNTPILGICLGMEIFFEKSQEGIEKGLGVIDGEVVLLPQSMKIPHMGWNSLEIKKPGRLLEGIENGSWMYFVHSYKADPSDPNIVTAESDYGIRIPAVVEYRNYFGTQFHPEKSGKAGSIIVRNFIKECKK